MTSQKLHGVVRGMALVVGFGGVAIKIAMSPASAQMPSGFADAAALVPGLVIEMRYAGPHNFTGAPVPGYEAPKCWLTRPAAEALAKVEQDLAVRGLGLKVFDCYRPLRAVARFVTWSKTPGELAGKREFFPDLPKAALFAQGYIAARSAHARGSTVDLTLVDRASGRALDMGTPFDFFGPSSHPDDRSLPAEVQSRRALLSAAMRLRGFVPYDKEWWHFTLRNEPYPATSFDVPIR